MNTRKKLIEVALPLEKINEEASLRKRKAPAGYPTTLHRWWAQRPLAAARAVIFAQMVDDPSSWPELFPTEEAQEVERQRLFRLIEQLVLWENTTNEDLLQQARDEIWKSWRRTCTKNQSHPQAADLFNPDKLPVFHDPFSGGGSLPLEAQRLGLESYASDLNPVAVLINKALIEIPPKFVGQPPVNPEARKGRMALDQQWRGAQGLAEDVRYYGQWMRDEAEKRIGHLYPKIEVTAEMVSDRPDLSVYLGQRLTVVAWLWARTVKSPNPAFRHVDVPLVSTFIVSTKPGRETYIEPVIERDSYRFTVRVGKPKNIDAAKNGTKLARGANFRCLMSGTPIAGDYIKAEGMAGRMGARLMAIVAEGARGRVYIAPTQEHEAIAWQDQPEWEPETPIPSDKRSMFTPLYGLTHFHHLFTRRQLIALNTFTDLIQEVRNVVCRDALSAGLHDDSRGLDAGGSGSVAYADAIAIYTAFAVDRLADYGSSLTTWRAKDSAMRASLSLQALPMTWDYAEGSPFGASSSGLNECMAVVARVIASVQIPIQGYAVQANAVSDIDSPRSAPVISTDPPYYDNVGYADLSDFFYVWLRRALKPVLPGLFTTLAVPKTDELVANPYRHGGKERAEAFFLSGMTRTMRRLAELSHPAFPITIYYAFKQSETDEKNETSSTGWETFLDAVIDAGFALTGTWPMRTEGDNRRVGIGANALASSIVLVCRPRSQEAPTATRRDFLAALKAELPTALRLLQAGNIAPVDLAQASIGPGMGVYTRYDKVIDASGKPLSVREALALINATLDEVLAEQEGDFDADTRWALAWFEQYGFDAGEYGVAETLSKAKNTSVGGMVSAGLIASGAGKVRLLRPEELPAQWDPTADSRLTVWEMTHHLVRVLEQGE
ncbi:MAG: DUF1156 domain-containing protein, partial [Oscillochloridaceae bacterium umkhey_bin13]